MKNLFLLLAISLSCLFSNGQTYSPNNFTVSNKAYGIAQAAPTDARSYYYDANLFIQRPYQSTAEVLSYLNLTKYRVGQFPIYVSSGTLQSGGTFAGGTITEYWFKDGTTNSNLVLRNPISETSNSIVFNSTTKGVVVPKLNSSQVNALANTNGALVYNTDTKEFNLNNGSSWLVINDSASIASRYSVATVAGLNFTPSDGTIATVQGFSSWFDGGGGQYVWIAAFNNQPIPGIIIQVGSSSGRWVKRSWLESGLINVHSLGVKGDGSNDYAATNFALQNFAYAGNTTLFFPKGVYNFTTGTDENTTFALGSISPNFKILGEPGTIFRVNNAGAIGHTLLAFFYGAKNLTIDGIAFENLHGLTANATHAIGTVQGGGSNFTDLTIKNCTFTGFSTAITTQGTLRLLIDHCIFLHPLGHDNAQTNEDPAVDIWGISANNGENIDATISNNYGDGYSGNDITSLTNKRGQDGFIYGKWNGLRVFNNKLERYSVESILLTPFDATTYTRPVVIERNIIDLAPPVGSTIYTKWAIRAEQSNLLIRDNIMTNVQNGIWVYGFSDDKLFRNVEISDNSIKLGGKNFSVFAPIFVQGNTANTIDAVKVHGNTIDVDSISLSQSQSLINLFDITNSSVTNNHVNLSRLTKNGHRLSLISYGNSVNNLSLEMKDISGTGFDSIYAPQTGSGSINNVSIDLPIKTGQAFFVGDGASVSFDISLPYTPTWVGLSTPANSGTGTIVSTIPITNGVRVTFNTAPASGDDGISVFYSYK